MDKKCAIYQIARIFGRKWTILILLEIYKGKDTTKRYSEIKRSLLEITPKILSSRLKDLEKEGLITKKIDSSSMPIKCEYSLTRSGNDFIGIIRHMKRWVYSWKVHNIACENQDCKDCVS